MLKLHIRGRQQDCNAALLMFYVLMQNDWMTSFAILDPFLREGRKCAGQSMQRQDCHAMSTMENSHIHRCSDDQVVTGA